MKRIGLRVIPLFGVVVLGAGLLGGCTVGQIVDNNFQPLPVGKGAFTFIAVGTDDKPSGDEYLYQFSGDTSSDGANVIFDSYAPDTMANINGRRNSKQAIPAGRYYVHLDKELGNSSGSGGGNGSNGKNYASPIFTHTYDQTNCTDLITGKPDLACEQYYFEIPFESSCATTENASPPCCLGTQLCEQQTLPLHDTVKVITLFPE